ncbi:MAG: Photosystem I reaction center subunit III [Cyanobacteria bacterium P01_F01_bin.42]
MRRFFSCVLVFTLLFGLGSSAFAAEPPLDMLVPCSESEAFQRRAATARNTTADPESGKKRFERYSQAMCGPEGLPHLIADGRFSHAGDFMIPGVMFLYIAGWIGWVGRTYVRINKKTAKNPAMSEIIINVPLAISCMVRGFAWPLLAFKELESGDLYAKDDEITVSPR